MNTFQLSYTDIMYFNLLVYAHFGSVRGPLLQFSGQQATIIQVHVHNYIRSAIPLYHLSVSQTDTEPIDWGWGRGRGRGGGG